jgi:hypothetical protein
MGGFRPGALRARTRARRSGAEGRLRCGCSLTRRRGGSSRACCDRDRRGHHRVRRHAAGLTLLQTSCDREWWPASTPGAPSGLRCRSHWLSVPMTMQASASPRRVPLARARHGGRALRYRDSTERATPRWLRFLLLLPSVRSSLKPRMALPRALALVGEPEHSDSCPYILAEGASATAQSNGLARKREIRGGSWRWPG